MTPKRLRKIERELLELNHSPQGRKPGVFTRLASKLGRTKRVRGKEPTYVREVPPKFTFPLSIPNHPELKVGTARSIIGALLDDVDTWRQWLNEHDGDEIEREDDNDNDDDDEGGSDEEVRV